jgi:hypothetical protein
MPIVFDEVVGEIAPEPAPVTAAEAEPAAGGDQQIRTLIRALARERWKQNRLRAR